MVIAVALHVAFGGGIPANDSWHTLIWGDELASGLVPDYEVRLAPTPHPLLILYAAALSPLGVAEPVLQVTGMVALAAIAVGLFRVGALLYGWPVGLLAAVLLLTRDQFLYLGARGSVDIVTLALIVWAAVLESGRARRGWPVIALLGLAGLLRPEAWLFAAAYWLWVATSRDWRTRVGLGALAAAAPLLWALSDFLVTGDPLWSLHGTQTLTDKLNRETGISALPGRIWLSLHSILSPPLVMVGVLGLIVGLVLMRRRSLLPAAILGLQAAAFAGLATFELPLNARYLLPAALILTLFAAVAGLGWVRFVPRGRLRTAWAVIGGAAVVGVAVFVVGQLSVVASVRNKLIDRQAIGEDVRTLLETPRVAGTIARCQPLVAPSNFRRPQLAYLTGRREESLAVATLGIPRERGVYVRAKTRREVRGPGRHGSRPPSRFNDFRRDTGPRAARVPEGYEYLAQSAFWLAYSRCADER